MTREGRGTSSRSVLLGFFGLIALAIGIFVVVYLKLLGYERVALRHVPPGAQLALRLDLRQVVLFAPIREHVVPVLIGSTAEQEDQESRLRRLEQATGVNLGMDVFEIVFVESGGEVGVVVGGRLPDGGVVEGLFRLLSQTPERGCSLAARRLSCKVPGVVVEQAEDGVLVAASSEQLLGRMLTPGTAYQALGMDPEAAGGGAWVPAESLARSPLLAAWPGAQSLAAVERIELRLALGDPVRVSLEAVPRAGQSLADLGPKLEAARPFLQTLLAFGPGQDYAGERAVLSRVRFGSRGDRATAEAEWQQSEMDQAARSLGAVLGAWLGGAGSSH